MNDVWNKAIEAAALVVQPIPHIEEERRCEDIAKKIRELKEDSKLMAGLLYRVTITKPGDYDIYEDKIVQVR